MNRKLARETTYKTLFSYLFTDEINPIFYQELVAANELDKQDTDYIERTLNGILQHEGDIKQLVAKYAKGFSLDRIYKPDLAVLLLIIYEMKYDDTIPVKVSINEGVEIVKRYSTTRSYSFVNGILASVAKELKETGSDDDTSAINTNVKQ